MKKNKNIKRKTIKRKTIKRKTIKRKTIKRKTIKRKTIKRKTIKRKTIKRKTIKSKTIKAKKNINNIKKNLSILKNKNTTESVLLKIIKLQELLKPNFNLNFNFNFFSKLENIIQGFFQKIDNKIQDYKNLKEDEKRRRKLEEIEKLENEKKEEAKKLKLDNEIKTKLKEKALKEEIKIEKERTKDIKLFLRQEQAIVRKEQAEKQRQFLKQLKIEKQIEKFRIREIKELEKLEKISLKEKREDYSGLQERIDKLKEKYRILRDQKIRERVEALGVKIQGNEDRETLLQKEKEYTIARQKIELSLESFYRSAGSLVFQLNKRHITRHMSIFRCVDRRFETGEIFIKWDESNDDDWLLLIYIKDNSPDKGIIIEDKSNPEKNLSHEFKPNEIFKASDLMVDSLTQLIARTRHKNN
tara:strand:+ start:319 stop:1560 length:1242 start_codon:yes stop_codon:yes gene_type:complete